MNRPRLTHEPIDIAPANLLIRPGLERAAIAGDDRTSNLIHVHTDRHHPRLVTDDVGFTLIYPRVTFSRRAHSDITLAAHQRWTICISGAVADAELDLRRLPLISLQVHGGVARTRIHLGPPQGPVPIALRSTSDVCMRLPAGCAFRIHVLRAASGLDIDGDLTSASKGPIVRASRGVGNADDRYEIRIGAAARTSITHDVHAIRGGG